MLQPGVLPVLQPQGDDKSGALATVAALEKARSSRLVVLWLSDLALLSDGCVAPLYDQLVALGDLEHLDLVLYTQGGHSEIPWRVIALVREFTRHLSILIPHRAASAGTTLALGADEIVMTRFAVLGPIDPSRQHPLLPRREGERPEPVSVQDMRHAMQFILEAGGDDMAYTPEAMAQIFTALFEKLHPLAIGAIEQSYALAKLVARRCLESHMSGPDDAVKVERIVNQFCDDYKSHAYQISRREAKEAGLNVKFPSKRVEAALMDLYRLYVARPTLPPMFAAPGTMFRSHIGWLDSRDLQFRCEGDNFVDPNGATRPAGDRWVEY
jgi:hypothetical protein